MKARVMLRNGKGGFERRYKSFKIHTFEGRFFIKNARRADSVYRPLEGLLKGYLEVGPVKVSEETTYFEI